MAGRSAALRLTDIVEVIERIISVTENLRVRPETLNGITKFSEHEAD